MDNIHAAIPDGAVEITEEWYNELLDRQSNGETITTDEHGYPVLVGPVPLSLEEARAAKLAEIISGSNKMSLVIKGKYSQLEIDSWQQQEAEARALLGDATTAAPLVRNLAANDGVSPLEFAKRIVANAGSAAAVGMSIILQQQSMEKRLKAADSFEAVQAIEVNYTV